MTSERFTTAVLVLGGLFFLVPGIWAFVDPRGFYDGVAEFPPYNRHFIHDIGAFQIGIGVALLAAAIWRDAALVALLGGAAGATMHAIAHIIDHDHGGQDSDPFLFAIIALLLVAGAAVRWMTLANTRETSP
jgi:uncharacterized membrane protein